MPAATCVSRGPAGRTTAFAVSQYDIGTTLNSGQTFRWKFRDGSWEGVLRSRWVRLTGSAGFIAAETVEEAGNWEWLADYLQSGVDLDSVLAVFPSDEPLRQAVNAWRGLRLLRQDPWECLASFILSSTKQIVQIQQVIRLVCERFGQPVRVPDGHTPAYSFPAAESLAQVSEADLRECKMGFRAPYLRAAAIAVADGALDLQGLSGVNTNQARAELLKLPGVGRKIADCVLLFAFGFQDAFPLDVWVKRALRDLYFAEQPVTDKQLEAFSQSHFGPFAGYAQQYLFHYVRTLSRPVKRK